MSGEPCPKIPRPPKVQRGLVRKPMKRKSKKRDNEFSPAVRAAVEARAGGRCEAQGPVCTGLGEVHHHILGRAQGGPGTEENDLYCCDADHPFIHAHSDWAYRHGLRLKKGWDPADCPIVPGHPLACKVDHRLKTHYTYVDVNTFPEAG